MTKPALTLAAPPLTIAPPRPLGEHGQAFWQRVQTEYAVSDTGGMELLAQAAAALDRAEECAAAIARDGLTIVAANGAIKDHPLAKVELANRAFVTRAIARLGLDVEPIQRVGRPPMKGYQG
ncbi:MAG: hypothetical protein ACK4NZ_10400 [Tsuneonella sp.]